MAQNFYFAWVTPGTAFNPAVHNVEDEDVFSFVMQQAEGDFASLELVIKNPRIGLLNPARKVWCWFAFNLGTDFAPDIKPLFHGRLIGVPDNIFDTLVTLKFMARPSDFVDQKAALAESLKVAPYYDPLFVSPSSWTDPDVVLEARTALWHIDPLTHVVSISDVIVPEDGVIEFEEGVPFYDGVAVSLQSVPLRSVEMTATIPWTQSDAGGFDMTYAILQAFPGSGGTGGLISSFTFEGLSSSWPQDGAAIGDGWVVRSGSLTDQSFLAVPAMHLPDYFDPTTIPQAVPAGSIIFRPQITNSTYGGVEGAGFDTTVQQVVVPIGYGRPELTVAYAAKRDYAQVVHFVMRTNVQPIVTLADEDERMILNLNANKASDLTADNSLPIGDVRSREFVHSDRGRDAVEHLIMVARANLIIRSRAVKVTFQTSFVDGIDVTLRKASLLHDHRLPGEQAEGKVIFYKFELDGQSGAALATIQMGCAVGYGGAYSEDAGDPLYVNAGYVDGYQEFENVITLLDSEDVTYTLPPSAIFDDGVDFIRGLNPNNAIKLLNFTNGPNTQRAALLAAVPGIGDQAAASSALEQVPTTVSLKLLPLSGGPFSGEVEVIVSDLIVPKQIDLEANSV